MSEDPIKLFGSRADRLPQADDGDRVAETTKRLIGHMPLVNIVADIVVPQFWVSALDRRRDEWLKDLADVVDRLCDRFENIATDEAFISASIKASRIAVATHQQEKREYLRNALLNIGMGKGPDEVRQQIFFNAVEAFSPAHVKTLDVIWRGAGRVRWDDRGVPIPRRNYGAAVEILVPELKGQPTLIEAVFTDLRTRGFSTLAKGDAPFPQGGLMANLGIEFLRFVLSPDDISRK